MKLINKKILLILFAAIVLNAASKAADTTQTPVRIAVLLPLNLDSAFSGGGYNLNLSNSKFRSTFYQDLIFITA